MQWAKRLLSTPSGGEKLYRDIVTDNADDYRFAQWQLAVIALVVVLILLVAWYGIRRMLLTPLAKIIAHIREITGGNLANTPDH